MYCIICIFRSAAPAAAAAVFSLPIYNYSFLGGFVVVTLLECNNSIDAV